MHDSNPYAVPPSQPTNFLPQDFRKVRIRPIELFKRGYALIGDQYWLFLGITFVGIIIGSMVPFAIILGPMLVGIYLCFMQRERGERVEFGTLFKGFDQFVDALVAMLVLLALSFLLIIPICIVMFVVMLALSAGGDEGGIAGLGFLILMYPVILLVSIAIYVPFIFTFQLIADRKLKGMDAVKLSARAAMQNLGGIIVFMIVLMIVSVLLTMMCYVPGILFLPISFASIFVLYRDVFPR